MFCVRYFCNRGFAPRYFAKVGAAAPFALRFRRTFFKRAGARGTGDR